MSFTISDAIAQVESWLNQEIVLGDNALLWSNEFIQNEVHSQAWAEGTETFAASEKGSWYSLPTDFLRVVEIVNDDTEPKEIADTYYTIRNNKITFVKNDTYTMTYVAIPEKMIDIVSPVGLSDMFLYPLAYFLAYKHLSKADNMVEMAEYYRQLCEVNLKSVLSDLELNSNGAGFQVEMRW